MPDVNDIYDTPEEQRRLAAILEQRYLAMLTAVHAAIIRLFGLDPNRYVVNDNAVNLMLVDAAHRVADIDETTRRDITEQLRVGQAMGFSNYELAHGRPDVGYRGIEGLYTETYRNRSETIARTELQHAQNEASLNRYAATGMVDMVKIIDGDEWDLPCAQRNGRIVPISERPQLNHPNCLIGGQIVWAANRQASSARWYDGEVVVLRTAADDLLTVTPNHPVLSRTGWRRAGELRQADRVFRCPDAERMVSAIDPNHEHRPALIEQIANATWPAGQSTTAAMPLSAEAFHGEATAGDICVIRTDRRSEMRIGQFRSEPTVVGTDAVSADFASSRAPLQPFNRVLTAAPSDMRRGSVSATSLRRTARFSESSRFAHGPSPAVLADPPRDRGWVDTDERPNLDDAELLDDVEIVEIRRLPFSGHVYNLQTEQGWYIASNLITHNCTMVLVPVLREGII
jgi:hypothetical protein